jgi:shikimate kinase
VTPLLVLVGPPGAGKTTVGLLVAAALHAEFRDTDHDIEQSFGKPVAEIFYDDGEPAFRAAETAAVAQALNHPGVLALGGGAVTDPATRALLKGHQVIYLSVGLTDAAARVGLARDRPVLALNPRAQLKFLLEQRAPLYLEVAAHTVVTDRRTPADIAAEVAALART